MEPYPKSIVRLINLLSELPGIGRKSATRMAFHILHAPKAYGNDLSDAIRAVKEKLRLCEKCFNLSDEPMCAICRNPKRDNQVLCVVETPSDLIAIEQTAAYQGLYHVLHGSIDPIQGMGPEKLKIDALIERIKREPIREIILATNPNASGTATALYLRKRLQPFNIRITRLAQGIPVGGDIEFVDSQTLVASLKQRLEF